MPVFEEQEPIRFGAFELNVRARELLRNGRRVRLQEQPFQVLVALLEHRGEVVTREELRRRMWPADTFVDFDTGLNAAVKRLRQALGDSADSPRFIETLPKIGYRFIAPVSVERELRYQSSAEIRAELRRLKQDTSSERAPAAATVSWAAAPVVKLPSSYKVLLAEAKRHKVGVGAISVALVFLVVTAGFGIFRLARRAPDRIEQMSIVQVTSGGTNWLAAISPNGQYIAYVKIAGERSVWVRQVATNSDIQAVPPGKAIYTGLTFSPDGNYLYLVRSNIVQDAYRNVYEMPALGGAMRQVASDADTRISFAPDGKRFVFRRDSLDNKENFLVIGDTDGGPERILTERKEPELFTGDPAWSPDGQSIAVTASNPDVEGATSRLLLIDVSTGTAREIHSQKRYMGDCLWLPDGSGILFIGIAIEPWRGQISFYSFPDKQVHRVTNDLNDYLGFDLTADGKTLVTVQDRTEATLLVGDGVGTLRALPGASDIRLMWWLDGERIFGDTYKETKWVIDSATGQQSIWPTKQLGSSPRRCGPYLFTWRDGIWRSNPDGSDRKLLIKDAGGMGGFTCRLDGNFLLYNDNVQAPAGEQSLWRADFDGQNKVRIAGEVGGPAISPDGKFVTFWQTKPKKALVVSSAGGPPVVTLEVKGSWLQFAPDGKSLESVISTPYFNIWRTPLFGGEARQMTKFEDAERIFSFGWSPDGKKLAVVRGHFVREIVKISNFR